MYLIRASISSSILIAGIILIKVMGRKYTSKRMISYLWNLALLRALLFARIKIDKVPFLGEQYHENKLSMIPINYNVLLENTRQITSKLLGKNETSYFRWDWQDIIIFIWAAGMTCCILYFVISYIREYRELHQSIPCSNEIAERMVRNQSIRRKIGLYQGKAFSAPITYGIFRPKIVLPVNLESISRVDLRNMIAHELVHIRRYDVAKRFLMATALCIHWFNPFIWIMYRYFHEDQEMSCDECVMMQMGEEQAKNYIFTIIKMAAEERSPLVTNGFLGSHTVKKRIMEAMTEKKVGWRNALAATVLCFCFGISFIARGSLAEKEMENVKWTKDSDILNIEATTENKDEISKIDPVFHMRDNRLQVSEDYDYSAAIKDVEENYNDFTQEPTEAQTFAVTMKTYITLAEVYKKKQENGIKLNSEELWIIDEFYKYVEQTP